MDDLDHSMRIAEEEWSSFYRESEECSVPQPLLACPEGLCYPDPLITSQSLQGSDENITDCLQRDLIQGALGTQKGDTAEGDMVQICNNTGSQHFRKEVLEPEETKKSKIETLEAVVNDVARSTSFERETVVRCQPEDDNKVPQREEKERWFVTLSLNHNQAARRACATARKKKTQLQKSTCGPRREHQSEKKEQVGEKGSCNIVQSQCKEMRHDDIVQRLPQGDDIKQNREEGTTNEEDIKKNNREEKLYDGDIMKNESSGSLREGEMMKHDSKDETLHGNREEFFQNLRGETVHDVMPNSREGTLDEDDDDERRQDKIEITLNGGDIVQNNSKEILPDIGAMQNDTEGNLQIDNTIEDNNQSTEGFHLGRVDSDVFEDSVEFFTLHSSGSEIYLSAQDLFEEDLTENLPMECPPGSFSSSLSHSCDPNLGSGAENLQDRESDPNCDDSPSFPVERIIQQKVDLPSVQTEPDQISCGGDAPRSVPDVIVTPVSEDPEAFAKAAGSTPCIYAISAFWDEMEKLTINDILQLRMAKSPPLTEMSDLLSQSSSLVDPEEHHLTDGGLTDVSDAADSDYFTQPDDSKADRSSWDFSVCDFEEDYWQFLGISRNPSPDLSCKTQKEDEEEEEGAIRSQTPVPVEDLAKLNPMTRGMTKNRSLQNVRALNTDDSFLRSRLHDDKKSIADSLRLITPTQGDALESFPASITTEETAHRNVICVYDPKGISSPPGCDDIFFTSEHKMLLANQSLKWKPIPIFSCSHPTVRELTLPEWNYPFLSADSFEEDIITPVGMVSHALWVAESQRGKSLLPLGKIGFQDNGSIWCRRSNGWELPGQSEKGSIIDLTVGGVSLPAPERQRIVGTIKPVRGGVVSVLQQSDICLACIALASWVLTSSDPQSTDAWKAALLANVSALSAIQYLRQIK